MFNYSRSNELKGNVTVSLSWNWSMGMLYTNYFWYKKGVSYSYLHNVLIKKKKNSIIYVCDVYGYLQ